MGLTRRQFMVGAAAIGFARPSRASIAREVSVRELCEASDACLVGRAQAARSEWMKLAGARRIVTTTRISVDEVIAGNAGRELMVQTLGGRVGTIGQVVHGEALLLRHEPCLLFVRGRLISYMAQGHYPLAAGSNGILELHSSPRVAELVRPSASSGIRLVGRCLDEARELVERAFRDARR